MDDEAANQKLPYGAEYAKSNRSSCKSCKDSISKGDLRMSLRLQSRHFDGLQDNWFHFDCFWGRTKSDINEATIRGFSWLKWEDQEKIRVRCKMIADDPSLAATPKSAVPKVEHAKSGAGRCFDCKEKVPKGDPRVSFRASNYHVPCFFNKKLYTGDADKINGFESLTEEEQKTIKGYLGEDEEKKPEKRKADEAGSSGLKKPKLDSSEREKLKTQSKVLWDVLDQLRTLPKKDVVALLEKNGSMWTKHGVEANLEQLADKMVFGNTAPCRTCGGQFRYSESAHGYTCTGSLSEYTRCRHCCRNPDRISFKVPRELREEHEFLKEYHKKPKLESRYYGSVVEKTKIQTPTTSNADKKRYERKLAEEELRRQVKNGCVVDPECEVSESVHVYVEKKKPWQALLSTADAATGKNSFYKLQILQHDRLPEYYVFRSWGRVGTTIGGNKTESFGDDLEAAKKVFEDVFLEKSKNEWADRHNFKKRLSGMDMVEVDFDDRDAPTATLDVQKSKSKLPVPVKEIISLFFDMKLMDSALQDFELDVEKMPLGKLSYKHLLNAHSVLSSIEKLILSGCTEKVQFLDLSNRFFTLMPHDFGMRNIPIIDSMDLLKQKTEMLDSLLEMEAAYRMVKQEHKDEEKGDKIDPFDNYYSQLNCDITVLKSDDKEVELIKKYAKNTHGKTHDFKLDIKEVFKINRHDENEHFTTDISNHQLLWHGSRVTNFAGILSQGLRIAPPEAPVNGYMFGKGIYFADMISKSAQYCGTNQKVDGFLLLCEVALGKIQEEKEANTEIKKPKSGYHSVKGLGGTAPNPEGMVTLPDGVKVPCGKAKTMSKSQDYHLLYNEYIVYNVNQVRMKYLVRATMTPSYV
ncbi:unnamed protein product [Bursaphelenchus okinawaensis]|uniref:Poly [ADP-ribose] polymerase n=1 Tax=Bursaphelenchus okinawaensis TaxID=465554 RepID=A0A811LAD7_9BILA|nr:unnamed protein product [Bursaphelenchus okinawaensis]CAG9120060.1 unnamed protein product [Bursaphelenchus okinawaensis]